MRIAFADEVKWDIQDTLGAEIPRLFKKPYASEVRALLQWWGTDLRRAADPEYWINRTMQKRFQHFMQVEPVPLIVVTDVRFRNEAEIIRALHGMVVEVVASDDTRRTRLGGQLPPAHASEEIDFPVDDQIMNDGGITAATPDLVEYVGLDPHCYHCRVLEQHVHHNSGLATGYSPPKPAYLNRGA